MQMADSYSNFMIYALENTGERVKLEISENDFIKKDNQSILDPSQVYIIVKEEIRRIYIWKGYESPVRKKFIASRVAAELQNELMHHANFHRCKIISVDQGDEPKEFLKNFNIKPIKLDKKEMKTEINQENIVKSSIKITDYPSIQQIKSKTIKTTEPYNKEKTSHQSFPDENQILDNLLTINSLKNYRRKHILVGYSKLYGIIKKKSEIFGEKIEKENWEAIENFPKDIIELDDFKLRIHIKNQIINAIELFEKEIDEIEIQKPDKRTTNKYLFENWTINSLRDYCKDNHISIPSGSKKNDILQFIEKYENSQ